MNNPKTPSPPGVDEAVEKIWKSIGKFGIEIYWDGDEKFVFRNHIEQILLDLIAPLTAEIEEYQETMELLHKCSMRANEMYREKHPEIDKNIWQDSAKLMVFLMEEIEELRGIIEKMLKVNDSIADIVGIASPEWRSAMKAKAKEVLDRKNKDK